MLSMQEADELFENVCENPLRARTLYLSERLWRKISRETRKRLLKNNKKTFFVNRYIANIVNDLRLYSDTETLNALADAIIEIYEEELYK